MCELCERVVYGIYGGRASRSRARLAAFLTRRRTELLRMSCWITSPALTIVRRSLQLVQEYQVYIRQRMDADVDDGKLENLQLSEEAKHIYTLQLVPANVWRKSCWVLKSERTQTWL